MPNYGGNISGDDYGYTSSVTYDGTGDGSDPYGYLGGFYGANQGAPTDMDTSNMTNLEKYGRKRKTDWWQVDPTDPDMEITDYLWGQSSGQLEDFFQNGLPSYSDHMSSVDPLSDYINQYMTTDTGWDANVDYAADRLGERLYGQGGGGSASAGHSGAGAAAYGELYGTAARGRYQDISNLALNQWNRDYTTAATDYQNIISPYQASLNMWSPHATQVKRRTPDDGPSTMETIGTVAGMGLGAAFGQSPAWAGIGGGVGGMLGGLF